MTRTVAAIPDQRHRWRCAGCGNLTRFDVVRKATTREFWHLDLAGEPVVEETETVDAEVVSLSCRWCGRDDAIEVVARPTADDSSGEPSEAAHPSGADIP